MTRIPPEHAGADPRFVRARDGALARALAPLVDDREAARVDATRMATLLLPASDAFVTKTAYEGIARVAPSAGERVVAPLEGPTAALADTLREALERAVQRALHGARRVAVMAGGGVDSSMLAALAVREARAQGGTDMFLVALDFEGPGDDRPHLRALEAMLGVDVVRVKPADAAPFVGTTFVADAAPATWPSVPLERALAEAAKAHGAERILSGAGGDDLFDGDLAELRALARVRRRVARFVPGPLRVLRRRRAARGDVPWAGPVVRDAQDAIAKTPPLPRARDATARYAAIATHPHLVEVATQRLQFAAASGVPRVDPFLDADLVELVARLPPRALVFGGRLRGLFREAARGLVPDSVRLRGDKAAFEPAQAEMVRAAGGFAALQPLADVPRAARLGLVDPARFAAAFAALADRPLDGDWLGVWPLLAVEAFLRERA